MLNAGLKASRRLHTALLYGIRTDTNNFDRYTLAEDISDYSYNMKNADMRLIRRIELNQTPPRYLKYFDYAFHRMNHFRGRQLGFLGSIESSDVFVQFADFYLHLIGTYYMVIAGIIWTYSLLFFAATDGYLKDCVILAQKAFGVYGNSGGHGSAARLEIPLEVLKE
jgi:nanoRNase/pAp phosphatase (c-di-AMP/oligoRNAs hydrolase)